MVKIVTNENFNSFIASGLVLIDFFAEWCGPCKMLSPVLDAVASELSNVSIGKVDIDNASATAEKYGVSSIPTLILFKNGEEVDRVVGLKDKDTLVKLITKHA
ncbi:thioredoxin [Chlamydia gallinacea]|uniref:Thioredoxin n=2 Tax=Chlamydia gallinacea TaxID=1457153 RepID=A0A173DYZ8_9CHLA|nr:thioredoxin [Chlamydia gallinacea]ANG66154.1 thioredoxin [Chlamydia gallinacea 08-1274/3]MBX6680648.1 thioredoxin [Chlamydia gallinacea]MBX6687927.1 thioredoxin [Chlamydia gallinacea]